MAKRIRDTQLRFDLPLEMTVHGNPFLKWAGGKSQLLPQFENFFPSKFKRYFEPFLGGAAVFFRLAPNNAILSDLNPDLIDTYLVVRDHVEELIQALICYKSKSNESNYYAIRDGIDPKELPLVERAARFIYLNKNCFNGLYRVNRRGKFNVPFGYYKSPSIFKAENLRNSSIALHNALLKVSDFEESVSIARKGDFVYFDPPYAPLTPTSSFTSYTKDNFDSQAHERLARVVKQLDKRGVLFMLSNSPKPFIIELYRSYHIEIVSANRAINSNGKKRGVVEELLVMNY
ncbi:MAG: site-specific DNA-methyltransferase (adenine-specific) [Chloroflexota bacterium]|nr:MAG: site-specific DNA-methyltransferase (adenine-specific) [Chloroflexota bacterium]